MSYQVLTSEINMCFLTTSNTLNDCVSVNSCQLENKNGQNIIVYDVVRLYLNCFANFFFTEEGKLNYFMVFKVWKRGENLAIWCQIYHFFSKLFNWFDILLSSSV